MQETSKRLLWIIAALVVVLVAYLIVTAPQPSDKEQIAAQMAAAQAAITKRSASKLLTVVSASYQSPDGMNIDQLHGQLLMAFRDAGPLSVEYTSPTISVAGDTAESICHVTIAGVDANPIYDGPVTIDWDREKSRRYLFIPSTQWLIVKVRTTAEMESAGY